MDAKTLNARAFSALSSAIAATLIVIVAVSFMLMTLSAWILLGIYALAIGSCAMTRQREARETIGADLSFFEALFLWHRYQPECDRVRMERGDYDAGDMEGG